MMNFTKQDQQDMSDVTTYSFNILTNEYAGNFHREMTCYITGAYDDSLYCEKEMQELFEADATDEEVQMFREYDFLDSRPTDEYGLRTNTINGWPCNNVEIYVLKEVIDEIGSKAWTALAKRAKQFLDLPFTKKYFPKLQILGFEIIIYKSSSERKAYQLD